VVGWLCANAGNAKAADSANSATTMFLTASAKVLCFIFLSIHYWLWKIWAQHSPQPVHGHWLIEAVRGRDRCQLSRIAAEVSRSGMSAICGPLIMGAVQYGDVGDFLGTGGWFMGKR
jgi:hypothetical protein